MTLRQKDAVKFIASVSGSLAAVAFGALFARSAGLVDALDTLNKPTTIPSVEFVRTLWLIEMAIAGVAFYFVWKKDVSNDLEGKLNKQKAFAIYVLHVAISALWPHTFATMPIILFGGLYLFLIITIIWTVDAFQKISKTATYIMIGMLLIRVLGIAQIYTLVKLNTNFFSLF